jgi:hypothetical protein
MYGGKEQFPPEKQLLLLIWYISNQESMREAANLFGISISTVHGTVLKVCHVMWWNCLQNDFNGCPVNPEVHAAVRG